MTFIKQLENMEACSEGMAWLKTAGYKTAAEAWKNCPRADWMIWFAGKKGVARKALVAMACACARTSLKYMPKGENRPRVAIETAEKWLRGEASLEDVETAYAAASASANAANAAYAAAFAAANAAYAAASASAAANAAYAAAAAAYAASTAAAYSAAYAARTEALKIMAEKIREIYPVLPKKKEKK